MRIDKFGGARSSLYQLMKAPLFTFDNTIKNS